MALKDDYILVTGGAGYIGSHTLVTLMEKGFRHLISLDNYSTSRPSSYALVEKITGFRPVVVEGAVGDRALIRHLMDTYKPAGVIHFAAWKAVGESMEKPFHYLENNISQMQVFLEEVFRRHKPVFIFSSSCTVYGEVQQLPVDETTPRRPANSVYGLTKQMGEDLLEGLCRMGFTGPLVALRYFNPVGAYPDGTLGEWPIGKPNNLLPIICQTAAGRLQQLTIHGQDYPTRDGTCIRDYVHVMDIAEAHVLALEYATKAASDRMEIFNLGTGSGVTVLEAVHAFEAANGIKLPWRIGPRRPGDVTAVYSNSRKAAEILSWKPRYSLHDMMRSAWLWQQYLENHKLPL